MAKLVSESELNATLENLIKNAEQTLSFFCPYFKLHDRLKDCLKLRRFDYNLRIQVVFGKNEDNPTKSLSKEDLDFLKSFPNIIIKYEKRLHAKYYANEKNGLITSLNLHSFSQNNNIEVGIYFKVKSFLKNIASQTLGDLTSVISDTEDIAAEAYDYFEGVFKNAENVFENEPQFESKLLGLQKKYTDSKVLTDNTGKFFDFEKTPYKESSQTGNQYFKNQNTIQPNPVIYNQPQTGFCIRTGQPISFNPSKPLSYEAFQSWAQFGNPDYNEKFCHACGKNWRTSVRNPFCANCG